METTLGTRAEELKDNLSQLTPEFKRVRDAVTHAFDDAVGAARRTMKRGRRATEDLIEEAAYNMKRYPLRTVGIVAASGLAVGVLLGWLIARRK